MSAQLQADQFEWKRVGPNLEACSYRSREEWLAIRRTGIGASDAAAALGVSKYKTPYQLWLEKRGEVEDADLSDNLSVQQGIILEAPVAEIYQLRTGRRIERVNRVLRRRDRPYMMATLDRRVIGERRLVEVKTVGLGNGGYVSDEWGEDATDKTPFHVGVQAQDQLAVTGYDVCDVPALLAGYGVRIYTIHRDEELIAMIEQRLEQFWNCVLTGEPPPVTTPDDALARWPLSQQAEAVATPDVITLVNRYRELDSQKDALDDELSRVKADICAFMADADTLVDGRGRKLLTWKTSRSFSDARAQEFYPEAYAAACAPAVDTDALKAAIGPKAYDALLVPSATRRFVLGKEQR